MFAQMFEGYYNTKQMNFNKYVSCLNMSRHTYSCDDTTKILTENVQELVDGKSRAAASYCYLKRQLKPIDRQLTRTYVLCNRSNNPGIKVGHPGGK